MNNLKQHWRKLIAIFSVFTMFGPAAHAMDATTHIANISSNTRLSPKIVELALKGHQWAIEHGDVRNKDVLTIVNYALPSNVPRLFVIDLNTDNVLMKTLVAHGSGSGGLYAEHFSNVPSSNQSSLGVFITGDMYVGHHGVSRRIVGLETGVNDNALSRAIVIHAAPYVSEAFGTEHPDLGLGRSHGCLAVNPAESTQLVNTVGAGSVIFSYADQEANDPNLKNIELA